MNLLEGINGSLGTNQNPGDSELNCLKYFFSRAAVINIKHVSTFVNKDENHCSYIWIFDLIDKCRYVFYDYDGSELLLWFFWVAFFGSCFLSRVFWVAYFQYIRTLHSPF